MKKKETIEFRQHEATLYSDRVQRWARFCVGVVQWAKGSSPDIMKHAARPGASEGRQRIEVVGSGWSDTRHAR